MAVNNDIFLGSGASLTMIPELDLKIILDSSSTATQLVADALWTDNVRMVENLYVGCVVELYDAGESTTERHSVHVVTSNDTTSFTISPAHNITVADATDFIIVRGYGAPAPTTKTGSIARLSADNWLGVLESATFPNLEVEMKQNNLSLGFGRNFTHQYKGIETASGGNLAVVANHGTWLYYALGKCTQINATFTGSSSLDPADIRTAHANNVHYLDIGETATAKAFSDNITGFTSTGPLFYRTAKDSTFMIPPVANQDTATHMALLTLPSFNASGVLQNPIKYTFAEADGEELPSFGLEQNVSKLEASNPYRTGDTTLTTESHNFVRIARGNRVNTLTMTANENEEVKMTLDLNSRAVHKLKTNEAYEGKAGQSEIADLFNFGSGSNTLAATGEESLEPFFFSSGSFTIFGEQFLKITNMTLTINNNLQDRRFIGVGNKSVKTGIPSQRNYEISFTALVTDNKLFEELLDQIEEGTSNLITLQFDKNAPDGTLNEQILLKFQDYFLSSANVTIPEDKGPVTIEGTVMPRKLNTCEVRTHWILQG
ncbi:MAG: hypothetical protein CL833_02790 [Crocinitomicaceae bacterium]|jgi:hypothetical protein|nr:hypothetical protein [Crocinitomicaceae bacterium]